MNLSWFSDFGLDAGNQDGLGPPKFKHFFSRKGTGTCLASIGMRTLFYSKHEIKAIGFNTADWIELVMYVNLGHLVHTQKAEINFVIIAGHERSCW
jgi:hypothetical protein